MNEVAGSLDSALGSCPGSMLKSSELVKMQRNGNENKIRFFLQTGKFLIEDIIAGIDGITYMKP